MLVVTTPTGQVGRHVLAKLVEAGESVRVIVRDRNRLAPTLVDRIELVEGSMEDQATLKKALDGAEGVFWCVPPDPRSYVKSYYRDFTRPFATSLVGSSVRRVVLVSSGGRGRARDAGPISDIHTVEELLESTGIPLRALRCGMFMENLLQQVELLRNQGMFSYPIDGDFAMPHCATRDIGARAAELLRDRAWDSQAGTGVYGPADLSFNEMAQVMTEVLGRPIRYQGVPGPQYKALLIEHGLREEFAQALVDMFREVAEGIYQADPRTQESTTPTSFKTWCIDTLKPAIG